MLTLGHMRIGAATAEVAEILAAVGIHDDMTLDALRARWTPEMAVELARLDWRGPRVGAVAWLDRVLGTKVFNLAYLRYGLANTCLDHVDASVLYYPGGDLRGASMRSMRLDHADLRWAGLDGADLRDSVLDYAVLNHCSFVGADLRGASLRGAKLEDVDMRGARLEGARFPCADY